MCLVVVQVGRVVGEGCLEEGVDQEEASVVGQHQQVACLEARLLQAVRQRVLGRRGACLGGVLEGAEGCLGVLPRRQQQEGLGLVEGHLSR